MTALRIRKPFRYPEDSDNEGRQELDEEEQEQVLRALQTQDDARNAEYTLVFTILPVISVAAFLPSMLSSSTTAYQRTLCVFSIISLFATAYIMRYIPPQRRDRKGKRPLRNIEEEKGTLKGYVVSVNAGLSMLLTLSSYFVGSSTLYGEMQWVLYLVPGAVLGIICIARKVMLSVDLSQLESLRYEYKGA